MKYIKLFENFDTTNQNPNSITLSFNGQSAYNKFKDQYWPKLGRDGGPASVVYQSHGWVANWTSLKGEGHPNAGEDGLIMKSGVYYPLFKTHDGRNGEGEWTYLSYSKENNEILIISSREHSDIGIEIEREMDKHPQGSQWFTKFKKVEAGEVDDRGYFKIVEVK